MIAKILLPCLLFAGVLATPAFALNVTWNTGTDVAVTSNGYTASGSVSFTLNFAPPVGTSLTVVNNTGSGFISGTFSNLAQGQALTLSYNGVNYYFVANYYGGTGNDLVLQWANVRPLTWGSNDSGQLGNGNTAQSSVPVGVLQSAVLAGKTVIAIAAGSSHSLALCSDGTLAAWGNNGSGQLGNNNTTDSHVAVAVFQSGVLTGKTVISVAAGDSHNLALCSDGTLAAWGNNDYGQLGNNSTTQSSVPVTVLQSGALAGKTVIAVAAGEYHSLALCSDGTLAAWGYNFHGELGNNSTTDSPVPVAVLQSGVLAGKTVIAVSSKQYHNLALCSDGTLAAWGQNWYGQSGNNRNKENNIVPVTVLQSGVLSGKSVIAVAAGNYHSLALCLDGTLAAWGNNDFGQLGNNGTTESDVPVAVLQSGVLAGKTVIAVAAGNTHSLALCSDGTLAAWGFNIHGELGNGSTAQSGVPVAVSQSGALAGKRAIALASGYEHGLALAAMPSSTVLAVPATSLTLAGATLLFTYTPSAAAVTDGVIFTVEYSDTLAAGSWTVNGVNQGSIGSGGAPVTATIPKGSGDHRFVRLQLTPTDLTILDAWRQTYFPGSTSTIGPGADTATPLNDGIANIIKFATGMDPTKPGIMPGAVALNGTNLQFSYTPNSDAVADGVIYTVEYSDTLAAGSWTSNGVNQGIIGSGGVPVIATIPIGSGDRLFVRLKITSQ